jgi:hypothetical protein
MNDKPDPILAGWFLLMVERWMKSKTEPEMNGDKRDIQEAVPCLKAGELCSSESLPLASSSTIGSAT